MLHALCATPVLPWERRWLVRSCPGQRCGSCSWPFVFSLGPTGAPGNGVWALPLLPKGDKDRNLQKSQVGSRG